MNAEEGSREISADNEVLVIYKGSYRQRATNQEVTLSQDVLANHVLPFLELPSHTFELEDHADEEDESDDEEE